MLTEEQLRLIASETQHAAAKALRKYTKRAVVGFSILVIGFGYNIVANRMAISHSDHVSERARSAVCEIITAGDYRTYQFVQEGTITVSQGNRALADSARYRVMLGPAPACKGEITKPVSLKP